MEYHKTKADVIADYIVANRENKEYVEHFLEELLAYHNQKLLEVYEIGRKTGRDQAYKEMQEQRWKDVMDELRKPPRL